MSKKITELNQLSAGSVANTDILLIVADPQSTPTNKYIEVGDLLQKHEELNSLVELVALNIDGGTDIGTAITDVDLFIIDDGAGGTNRKATASRLDTYFSATSSTLTNKTLTSPNINEAVTLTATATELNILDGSATTQSSIILENTDGVVISDGDVMTQCLISDIDVGIGVRNNIITSTNKKVQQKGACLQSSTHQALFL
jgi:hypothetical protein